MEENILGKNIKYLRKQYGETLRELGHNIDKARNTVSGYESGKEPDLETLNEISKHYGKTVDEMLNAKLYELEEFDSTKIVDLNEINGALLQVLPLIESEEACANDSFCKGIKEIREMLNSFSKGENVKGTVIENAAEYFAMAVEDEVYEACANMLWCIFFLWSQQYTDLNSLLRLQARLVSKQVDWKEMIYETQKNDKKAIHKKKAFIEDFDEVLNELIKILKELEKWAKLGDYYLALRYVLGIVDTGNSDEMNRAVGMQMMIAFAQLDNKYALNFLKAGVEMK